MGNRQPSPELPTGYYVGEVMNPDDRATPGPIEQEFLDSQGEEEPIIPWEKFNNPTITEPDTEGKGLRTSRSDY
jgi:hypothetical protein